MGLTDTLSNINQHVSYKLRITITSKSRSIQRLAEVAKKAYTQAVIVCRTKKLMWSKYVKCDGKDVMVGNVKIISGCLHNCK